MKEVDLHHVNINLENIRRASLDGYVDYAFDEFGGCSTTNLSSLVHCLEKFGYKQGFHLYQQLSYLEGRPYLSTGNQRVEQLRIELFCIYFCNFVRFRGG